MRRFAATCRPGSFDTGDPPYAEEDLQGPTSRSSMRAAMADFGDAEVPLAVTEISWGLLAAER